MTDSTQQPGPFMPNEAALHRLVVQENGEPACACGFTSDNEMRLLAIADVKVHIVSAKEDDTGFRP